MHPRAHGRPRRRDAARVGGVYCATHNINDVLRIGLDVVGPPGNMTIRTNKHELALVEAFEFGAFMAVVGVFQIVSSAILVVRPSRLLVVVIMVFNALVVITYTIAYTVGLPFGPNPGEPEKLNTLGSAATLGELALLVVLIGVLLALLRRGGFNQPPGSSPV